MSIERRPTGWQVNVRPFPRQTVATKSAAVALETQLKLRKQLGQYYQAPPATLGQELDEYLGRLETLGGRRGTLAPRSIAAYKVRAAHWDPLRDRLVSKLTRVDVETLVISVAKTHPSAAQDMLKTLRGCLRQAASRGQSIDPAIFEIRPPVVRPKSEPKVLTLAEVDLLAAKLPAYIRLVVPFVASVGLRREEAFELTDDRVDLEAGTIFIPAAMCKERRPKRIELSPRELQLLRRQLLVRARGSSHVFAAFHGGKLHQSAFNKRWNKARDQAGLPGFKFHWLRHTAISQMAEAGMAVETIAERVGHADGGSLIYRTYRHLFPGETRRALALLDEHVARRLSPDGPRSIEEGV